MTIMKQLIIHTQEKEVLKIFIKKKMMNTARKKQNINQNLILNTFQSKNYIFKNFTNLKILTVFPLSYIRMRQSILSR